LKYYYYYYYYYYYISLWNGFYDVSDNLYDFQNVKEITNNDHEAKSYPSLVVCLSIILFFNYLKIFILIHYKIVFFLIITKRFERDYSNLTYKFIDW
jgi:hypothetical protein